MIIKNKTVRYASISFMAVLSLTAIKNTKGLKYGILPSPQPVKEVVVLARKI